MPSASPTTGLVLLGLVGLVAGCGTTQETSARLKVRAERILAGREPVALGAENPNVRGVDAAVLGQGTDAAVAVRLRNESGKPLNDLPILVGVKTGGGDTLVNRGGSFRYFQAHTPGLAPRRDTTWVFTAPAKKLPAGDPVVRVGTASEPPTVAEDIPTLGVSGVASDSTKDGDTVRATVDNDAGFPQYDLAVYAWAERDGRIVAASQKSIGDLRTGERKVVRLDLIGDPGAAKVHVSAPPTIFE